MRPITLIFFAIVLVFVAACAVEEPEKPIDEPKDDEAGFAGITKQQCIDAGGNWNECGSPCAGTDADFCIQVCQVQCECGGIAGFSCPEGFKCRLSGKIADEIGVCVPK